MTQSKVTSVSKYTNAQKLLWQFLQEKFWNIKHFALLFKIAQNITKKLLPSPKWQ